MAQVPEQKDWILAPAAGGDAEQLVKSAAEGYLFSRIDGTTPWRLLREIGGIPPEDVDACLRRWLDEGALEVVGGKAGSSAGAGGPKSETAAPTVDAAEAVTAIVIDESALDEGLDIDLDVQRRILTYEASLGRPYHELLGVEPGSEPKAVKRAYFKLSKEFHPDRYFRREIGSYAERLDRIFKKVLEAHEILSDPELCQVENHTPSAPVEEAAPVDAASVPESPSADAQPGTEEAKPAKPRPLTKLERLKQRMPFKINHAAIQARRQQADEIFRAAQGSQQAGRLQEAEASIRIAISFDPARAEFKEALGSLKIAAAGARAANLLAKPSERMSDTELFEALRLIEDVLPYRPHDPELNERAGRICLRLEKYDEARDYLETLLIRQPESAVAYTMLGKIHKALGDLDEAVKAFETALKFDEDDLDARRALAAVRIGARDAARGGRTS
ncbi:MAG: tetratricopeptide repeat protein [bacterium]|nr:tetratricopeptide repeat protein [bacterium]